jgi:hypothetical protein
LLAEVWCSDRHLEAALEIHKNENSLGVHGMDCPSGGINPVTPACLQPSMLDMWRHCRYEICIPNTSHSTGGPCMCMCLVSPQHVMSAQTLRQRLVQNLQGLSELCNEKRARTLQDRQEERTLGHLCTSPETSSQICPVQKTQTAHKEYLCHLPRVLSSE